MKLKEELLLLTARRAGDFGENEDKLLTLFLDWIYFMTDSPNKAVLSSKSYFLSV